MRIACRLLLVAAALSLLSGCESVDRMMGKKPPPDPNAPKRERVEPTRTTGRNALVLSVHMRKAYPDACTFGVTGTNNLTIKVRSLAVRFNGYIRGNVLYDTITKSFFELRPTEQQYREFTYQVPCREIDRIEVSDPGRCVLGEDDRFTTDAGDCAKYFDVAASPYVRVVKKR